MEKTFLFYDIETSGLNPCFDQVLQFAAIRTDTDLNELEHHEIFIKLNCDVLPSPEALLTHGITLQELENGKTEYEAIQYIHQLVNQPGTISLGYNTLGFDDEFLRFSFYRNLLPPYTHQYANFCGRADIYPLTVAYFLYKNDIINWPVIDEKINLRLENLIRLNGLAEGTAHNAMVDVKATLALAKRLKSEKEIWDYLLGFFDKKIDYERSTKFSDGLENHPQALWLDGALGSYHNFQCPVLYLGESEQYKNQTLWLRLDKPELVETKPLHIPETTWVYRKKRGEPGFLFPTSARFMQKLSPERQAIMTANLSWLNANPDLFGAIKDYYIHYTYPTVEKLDVDAALYDIDFPTHVEQQLCNEFHRADPKSKAQLLDRIANTNLRERAIRILGRHFPHYLPDKYRQQFEIHMQSLDPISVEQVWEDYRKRPRLTRPQVLKQLEEMKNRQPSLEPKQLHLLNELTHYLSAC